LKGPKDKTESEIEHARLLTRAHTKAKKNTEGKKDPPGLGQFFSLPSRFKLLAHIHVSQNVCVRVCVSGCLYVLSFLFPLSFRQPKKVGRFISPSPSSLPPSLPPSFPDFLSLPTFLFFSLPLIFFSIDFAIKGLDLFFRF